MEKTLFIESETDVNIIELSSVVVEEVSDIVQHGKEPDEIIKDLDTTSRGYRIPYPGVRYYSNK